MDELNYIYIYYLNDEQKPITVQLIHSFFFDPNAPFKEPKHDFVTLQACEGRLFKIEAPQGSIPYVKKWTNKILLTYQDLEQLRVLEFHRTGAGG